MNKDRLGALFDRLGLRWPDAPALLAWLLPVFAWAPLAYPGYPELHSGFLPVFNLVDLSARWRDWGWMPLIGRPFDLLRGEGFLPYVLAALFRLAGALPADAVKLVFAGSLIAGSVGMYRWARQRLASWPALVAAMVYVYWPLGLATVLVRGALAEAFVLGLLPWVLQAAANLRSNGFSRSWHPRATEVATTKGNVFRAAAFALGLAAVLWTQAGLGVWLAVLLLGGWLVGLRLRPRAGAAQPASAGHGGAGRGIFLAGWAGGLALAALGLLPAVLRHGWGSATYVVFGEHLVYPHQLLWPGWGRGPSIPGADDTLSFSLGIMAFALVVIALVLSGRRTGLGRSPVRRSEVLCSLALVVSLVWLASTFAAAFWRFLPALSGTLTYPWQLLLLAGPWLAWLAGVGAHRLCTTLPPRGRQRQAISLSGALIVLVVLAVYGDLRLETAKASIPNAPVAIFGQDEIALLRVTTAGTPGPGGRVSVAVEWQALRPLDRDYTVFFHVLGPDGTRHGQQDTMPLSGRLPTSRWRPGQVVADEYQVTLPIDAPVSDSYRYWLGFYLSETGARLGVGGDDKLVIQP